MDSQRIAAHMVEAFEHRFEDTDDGNDLCAIADPHVTITSGYVAVRVFDTTVWDSEDQNSPPENEWDTPESAMVHAENVIRKIFMAVRRFSPTTEADYDTRKAVTIAERQLHSKAIWNEPELSDDDILAQAVLALVEERKDMITIEAHEMCCDEHARQVATCDVDHAEEARQLRRLLEEAQYLSCTVSCCDYERPKCKTHLAIARALTTTGG